MRWHDLRHTTASLAIQAGGHALLVRKLLGHASVVITLDTYSHLLPGDPGGLAAKLDAIYEEAAEQPATNGVALGR